MKLRFAGVIKLIWHGLKLKEIEIQQNLVKDTYILYVTNTESSKNCQRKP